MYSYVQSALAYNLYTGSHTMDEKRMPPPELACTAVPSPLSTEGGKAAGQEPVDVCRVMRPLRVCERTKSRSRWDSIVVAGPQVGS